MLCVSYHTYFMKRIQCSMSLIIEHFIILQYVFYLCTQCTFFYTYASFNLTVLFISVPFITTDYFQSPPHTTLKYVFRIMILQFFTERFLRIWDRRWSFKKTISHKENQVNLAPNYVTIDQCVAIVWLLRYDDMKGQVLDVSELRLFFLSFFFHPMNFFSRVYFFYPATL